MANITEFLPGSPKKWHIDSVAGLVDHLNNTYTQSEIDGLVAGIIQPAVVADLPARALLADLQVGQKIFVGDDGDGKFAEYIVSSIEDGDTGSTATFIKTNDKDFQTTLLEAAEIKTLLESNADTNTLTDAEKLTIASIIAVDGLITDVNLVGASDSKLASSLAIKTYVDNAKAEAMAGGSNDLMESLTVSGNSITLTNEPKNGLNSIANFASVEAEINGTTYHHRLASTADAKIFDLVDASGSAVTGMDAVSVKVQYAY